MKITFSTWLNIALLVILTSSLFFMNTTADEQAVNPYDPWYDLNDDGEIDVYDLVIVASRYGTKGTPIPKAEWCHWVNETLIELLSRIDDLETQIDEMNTTITDFNTTIYALNATVIQYELRLATLEAFEVNSTYSNLWRSTTETMSWIDMPYMQVTINLQRTSHILILFSTEADITSGHGSIRVRACIEDNVTSPSEVYLTPAISEELCPLQCHRHSLEFGAYSFNFYASSVPVGNYTIKIQWRLLSLEDGIAGWVRDRTLTVLAFPIE